jgi:rhodanese-related sulfurtransferase
VSGRAETSVAELPAERVLLDVREDDEWQAGHAPDAVHVPMSELAGRLDEVPDAAPLYVICRSGGRSERVTGYLNANGWEAVNVSDGMSAWARLGLPLVSETASAPEVI